MDIQALIQKAGRSKFQLWKLNKVLAIGIPFNKPHRFDILEVKKGFAKVSLPYRKSNLNHIKTIHACAMATCAEYTSGLVLGTQFSFKEYRLIMKEIHVAYFYQGKMNASCSFTLSEEECKEIRKKIEVDDHCDLEVQVQCLDQENNHLSTAKITWQIKPWSKTRSKNS